jgi:cell shape-determining protein MreC
LATGFQGFFPAGTPFGTVVEEGVDRTGEFKVLTVQLFADYRNLRYVEVIDVGDREQLDALGRRIPQPE